MKEREYNKKIIEKVGENHIWLNALTCVKPTQEFKIHLAETILKFLEQKERTIPAEYVTSKDKNLQELAKLTPMLYLSINKS